MRYYESAAKVYNYSVSMRSADDFLRGRSCGGAEPRAQAPGRGPHSPHGILRKRASETQELQGPQKQQKQNSRNHRSRRNPGPQRPPVPPAETQKTLRPPHVCGSRRVRHRMPRPERSGKSIRSIAAALRHRDSGPQGSASSYFAARSSPSSSIEPTTRSS